MGWRGTFSRQPERGDNMQTPYKCRLCGQTVCEEVRSTIHGYSVKLFCPNKCWTVFSGKPTTLNRAQKQVEEWLQYFCVGGENSNAEQISFDSL